MDEPRPGSGGITLNAANRRQVRDAGRVEKRREQRRAAAYRAVLGTVEGRFVFWDLIGRAGVYRSVSNPHGGIQSQNIGRQDFGHELMDLVIQAGDELYLLMEQEGRALATRDAQETDARSTASVNEERTE